MIRAKDENVVVEIRMRGKCSLLLWFSGLLGIIFRRLSIITVTAFQNKFYYFTNKRLKCISA